jgi:hypothetical protein
MSQYFIVWEWDGHGRPPREGYRMLREGDAAQFVAVTGIHFIQQPFFGDQQLIWFELWSFSKMHRGWIGNGPASQPYLCPVTFTGDSLSEGQFRPI